MFEHLFSPTVRQQPVQLQQDLTVSSSTAHTTICHIHSFQEESTIEQMNTAVHWEIV